MPRNNQTLSNLTLSERLNGSRDSVLNCLGQALLSLTDNDLLIAQYTRPLCYGAITHLMTGRVQMEMLYSLINYFGCSPLDEKLDSGLAQH